MQAVGAYASTCYLCLHLWPHLSVCLSAWLGSALGAVTAGIGKMVVRMRVGGQEPHPSLQEHAQSDSVRAATAPSSAGQQTQRAHGQASPDVHGCQSGGGGVLRRRASRASVDLD